MDPRSHRKDLTTRLARDFMLRHKMTPSDIEGLLGGRYTEPLWSILREEVAGYDPATLGIIAASGRGYYDHLPGKILKDVHRSFPGEGWLHSLDSGLDLLFNIAVSALICRMSDLCDGE